MPEGWPSWLTVPPGLAPVGAAGLLYKLITFPRWSDEMRHASR